MRTVNLSMASNEKKSDFCDFVIFVIVKMEGAVKAARDFSKGNWSFKFHQQ